MIRISQYAESQAAAFRAHPIFERLAAAADRSAFATMAPSLTFLTFTWQEVLRLNAERAADPIVQQICTQSRADERNHERWLLHDLSVLRPDLDLNPGWLFNDEQRRVRDACYDIIGEVSGRPDDWTRVTVILAIEAGSKVFFSAIMPVLIERGWTDKLAYYSPHHLESEFSHDMYQDEFYAKLRGRCLDADEVTQQLAVVDRIHRALAIIFDYADQLVATSGQPVLAQPPVRARRPSYVA